MRVQFEGYCKFPLVPTHSCVCLYHHPGFVFPGKPGTACVEGTAEAVSEFGKSLRSLQWQKLGSRHIDRFPQLRDAAELEALRRFARPMVELGGEATAVGGSLHSDQVRCWDFFAYTNHL